MWLFIFQKHSTAYTVHSRDMWLIVIRLCKCYIMHNALSESDWPTATSQHWSVLSDSSNIYQQSCMVHKRQKEEDKNQRRHVKKKRTCKVCKSVHSYSLLLLKTGFSSCQIHWCQFHWVAPWGTCSTYTLDGWSEQTKWQGASQLVQSCAIRLLPLVCKEGCQTFVDSSCLYCR